MARIRTVHPQTAQDRKLASVSRDARYTFVLTWTIADDEGFFRAEPRQLLGQLYPFDNQLDGSHLEAWLSELVSIGVLRWRFTRDGARVGQVVNWPKYQRIDRPSKSFLASQLEGLAEGSRDCGEGEARVQRLESLSPESRVLSLESRSGAPAREELATLQEKLPATAHPALEGYYRAAQFPAAVLAAILAEGPDTGVNAAPGKTWDIVGQALTEMQAAGCPFSPAILRAFCRRLLVPEAAAPSDNGSVRILRERAIEMFRAAGVQLPTKLPEFFTSVAAVEKAIAAQRQRVAS